MSNNFKTSLKAVEYRNVYITNSGVGLKRLLPIKETLFLQNRWKHKIHFYLYALYTYFTKSALDIEEGQYVCIHHHWSRGYHHWLSEILLKIQYIPGSLSEKTLLLPEDYPEFAFQSLEVFDFHSIRKIPKKFSIRIRKVLFVENPYSGTFKPQDIKKIRELFWRFYGSNEKPNKNLYISRRFVPFRRISNEDEVCNLLEAHNFSVIYPEKMPFKKQVELFSQCTTLVSIHGAGLTNCIFMKPGGQILELYRDLSDKREPKNMCFQNLAEASGLDFQVQYCKEGENRSPKSNDADLYVDIPLLEANLSKILKESLPT